ncbi:hypothetical protein SY111_03870 [Ligilactobacillus agilis]|uniref:Uncharacterized protein n=1 Tax=Ligilactobacillus agilis TaxID=1601 RepID=A0A6F9XR61_9LACO|nr:hypothetical protein SY111_03870 [Ligilactobacillus agilis]
MSQGASGARRRRATLDSHSGKNLDIKEQLAVSSALRRGDPR